MKVNNTNLTKEVFVQSLIRYPWIETYFVDYSLFLPIMFKLTVKSCDLEILVYSLDKYSIKNINTPEEEAARFVELDVKQPQLEKFIQEQLEIIRINPHFLTEPKDFCTVTINQKRINES